jgi:hypothetical protein
MRYGESYGVLCAVLFGTVPFQGLFMPNGEEERAETKCKSEGEKIFESIGHRSLSTLFPIATIHKYLRPGAHCRAPTALYDLDAVGFADGEYLLQVVFAVDELKLAPLVDSEGTECHVAGELAGGAEEFLCFGAEKVELREVVGGGLSEVFAADGMGCRCSRCDKRRGLATMWEISETDHGVLAEMLGDAGFGAGRVAFGEAGVESHLCAGVA